MRRPRSGEQEPGQLESNSRGERAVGFAVALGAVGMLTALASAVVTQAADSWQYSGFDPVPLNIAVAMVFSAMGVLVTWHKPGNVLGWTMLAIAAWAGVGVLLTTLTGALEPASVTVIMAIQSWWWAPPIWAISTLLPMIYPDGRLPSRRWWWVVAGTAVALLVYEVGLVFAEGDFAGRHLIPNPLAYPELQELASVCLVVGEYGLLAATVVAVLGLVSRWLRATGVHRRRITLLLCAFAFGAAQAVLRDSLPGQLPLVADRGLEVLAFVLVPLAIAVAVTRDRLYDLDIAVRRGVVAVAATSTLVACYVGGYAILAAVLPARVVPGSVLAVGVAGVVIFPVALLLIRRVRSLIWGGRIDVVELAVGLGNRMRNQLDTAEVPAAVCEQIVRSLRLRMARLDLETDPVRPVAAGGDGAVAGHVGAVEAGGGGRVPNRGRGTDQRGASRAGHPRRDHRPGGRGPPGGPGARRRRRRAPGRHPPRHGHALHGPTSTRDSGRVLLPKRRGGHGGPSRAAGGHRSRPRLTSTGNGTSVRNVPVAFRSRSKVQ